MRGCLIPFWATWDKRGSFGVPLYQKEPKSVKKLLSEGHFPWEVAWFHWEAHRTKGHPLVFICTKKIQNWSRNGWITAIFPIEKHIMHHWSCTMYHCKLFFWAVKGCVTRKLQSSGVEASKKWSGHHKKKLQWSFANWLFWKPVKKDSLNPKINSSKM